jgi:nicotinate dehydrogenase subunit B
LKSVDIPKMKDVHVIQDDDVVAVLHKNPDEAKKALGKIKAEYDMPQKGLNDKNIHDHLVKVPVQPRVQWQNGNIDEGIKLSNDIFEETYRGPYVAHAPIETHTSTANIENGKVTVWAATQGPFGVQSSVAEALKIPRNEAGDKVRVITPFVGGAFGGKMANPEAVEAARLARLTGKPVQVSGERCAEVFYDIPHHKVNVYGSWMMPPPGAHPLRVGPWRAPGGPNNIHAKELQISLMAAKAGIDPLEFRLKNTKDKKAIGVLKAAGEKFGYTPSKPVSGRGIGISCGIDAGTYAAHICEIEVDKKPER